MRFIQAAMTPVSFADIYYALTQGAKKKGRDDFEDAMTSYLGAHNSYTFTSFVRAIYTCLSSLKRVDRRKKIILPRYCCPDFTRAVFAAGLEIEYCDVNPNTLSFDLKSLSEANLKDVLALICVNHLGFVNPMNEIADLCKRNEVYLIEDLGYTLGTEIHGRKVGTFGDFAVLNFREGKAIPIGGGMVTSRRESVMDQFNRTPKVKVSSNIPMMFGYKLLSNPYMYSLLMKANQLLRINLQARFSMEDTGRGSTNERDYKFDPTEPLHSISNFQGALGLRGLSKMNKHMEMRAKNASALETELSLVDNISIIQKEPGCNNIHYIRFPILVEERIREFILAELLKHGVEASPMYTQVRPDPNRFPGAARVSREILTLPCHPALKERDLKTIISVIRNSIRSAPRKVV